MHITLWGQLAGTPPQVSSGHTALDFRDGSSYPASDKRLFDEMESSTEGETETCLQVAKITKLSTYVSSVESRLPAEAELRLRNTS